MAESQTAVVGSGRGDAEAENESDRAYSHRVLARGRYLRIEGIQGGLIQSVRIVPRSECQAIDDGGGAVPRPAQRRGSLRGATRALRTGGHAPSLARRFRELADRWKAETRFTSSVVEMSVHPAYQEIIGMGPAALPLLLRELEREPGHWFWALKAITGADPVGPRQRGCLPEMAEAWRSWAREQGIGW